MFGVRIYFIVMLLVPLGAMAEDGSQLWLRYHPVNAEVAKSRMIQVNSKHETALLARQELDTYWKGRSVELKVQKNEAKLKEGYRIEATGGTVRVTAAQPIGLLYAAYHLLRLQEMSMLNDQLRIEEIPSYDVRILNHWDNLDGTIERGYAGHSLWKWSELPSVISPRYAAYARANASIGINATVLNNVNASPQILDAAYLEKVKALADVFRPYGIRVYLSVNFSSPVVLGGTADADPTREEVQDWWKKKVKEVYALVPDFGGFLVKANSEGQPGPQD